MTPVWDEKPHREFYAESDTLNLYAMDMAVWLEKLKVEFDLLAEHSGRWLHFVAVDYPEINESLSPKKLMELKEKAEKLDQMEQLDLFDIMRKQMAALEEREKKLEAVMTWCKQYKPPEGPFNRLTFDPFIELDEILEASG